MTILNCLDESNYLVCREGVEFYYFGKGCIADYYSNSIAYIDEVDIEVLKLCCHNSIREIKQLYSSIIESEDAFLEKIRRLVKKGILVVSKNSKSVLPKFHGKKGLFFPKEITIELTNSCNYACPFCYKNAHAKGSFISDETIQKIDSIVHKKVYNFLLTGGEPTLHPNYLKYIDLFSKYARVSMITNGSILFAHDFTVLKKLDQIQFSIYGCDNHEYERMTGCCDGFTRLCKSIECSKRNGIYTKAAVTLCDSTLDHIELFVKTAIELEVNSLKIGIADLFGRGNYLYKPSSDFSSRLNDAYRELAELKRKYGDKIKMEIPNINYSHVNNHLDIHANVYRGSLNCGCGSEYIVVSHTGDIRPCQMLPESWFSLRNINALEEHILGNFHVSQLITSANNYYVCNDFRRMDLSPCHALDSLVASCKA